MKWVPVLASLGLNQENKQNMGPLPNWFLFASETRTILLAALVFKPPGMFYVLFIIVES